MAGFALAAGGDGSAPVRRSAPGGRRARVRSAGVMGSVSWPGRGARATSPASRAHWGVMRPGGPGWGRWVLRGAVEAVDPSPRGLGDSVGQGLSARVAERGVAEALVVARGWWVCRGFGGGGVRRPGSARAPAGRGGDSAPAGARGRAVVGRAGAGARPGPAAPPCRRRRWPPGRPRRQGPWRPSCRRALIGPRPRSRAPPEPRAHRGPGREPDRAGGSGRHRARRDRGPPAAAGPSPRRAPAQDAGASLRQMPRPAPTPRGASSGHRAIARRTRGPAPRLLSGPTPQSQTTSVTTRTRRTVTHALRHHTATGPAEGGHDEHPYDLAARPATPDAPGVEAPVLVRKVQCEELGGSEQS